MGLCMYGCTSVSCYLCGYHPWQGGRAYGRPGTCAQYAGEDVSLACVASGVPLQCMDKPVLSIRCVIQMTFNRKKVSRVPELIHLVCLEASVSETRYIPMCSVIQYLPSFAF